MLSPAKLDLAMVEGDNTPLRLVFRDYDDKTLSDLSDYTLEAMILLSGGTIPLELETTGSDLAEGLLVLTIATADLADVVPGLHSWWVKATDGDDVTQTLIRGTLLVTKASQ